MFTNNGYYKTSTDYQKLFELLCAGHSIACLVDDYNRGVPTGEKELCRASRFEEFDINFSSPGCGYISITSYDREKYSPKSELEIFAIKCKRMNVEWILSYNDGLKDMSKVAVE